MSGGFALVFISFFFAISSFVVALLFIHSARVMDAILADPSPLAHWTYPEETICVNVVREYRNYQERNHAMFIVIGGMLGAVGESVELNMVALKSGAARQKCQH